jgi:hypothetical protein
MFGEASFKNVLWFMWSTVILIFNIQSEKKYQRFFLFKFKLDIDSCHGVFKKITMNLSALKLKKFDFFK